MKVTELMKSMIADFGSDEGAEEKIVEVFTGNRFSEDESEKYQHAEETKGEEHNGINR